MFAAPERGATVSADGEDLSSSAKTLLQIKSVVARIQQASGYSPSNQPSSGALAAVLDASQVSAEELQRARAAERDRNASAQGPSEAPRFDSFGGGGSGGGGGGLGGGVSRSLPRRLMSMAPNLRALRGCASGTQHELFHSPIRTQSVTAARSSSGAAAYESFLASQHPSAPGAGTAYGFAQAAARGAAAVTDATSDHISSSSVSGGGSPLPLPHLPALGSSLALSASAGGPGSGRKAALWAGFDALERPFAEGALLRSDWAAASRDAPEFALDDAFAGSRAFRDGCWAAFQPSSASGVGAGLGTGVRVRRLDTMFPSRCLHVRDGAAAPYALGGAAEAQPTLDKIMDPTPAAARNWRLALAALHFVALLAERPEGMWVPVLVPRDRPEASARRICSLVAAQWRANAAAVVAQLRALREMLVSRGGVEPKGGKAAPPDLATANSPASAVVPASALADVPSADEMDAALRAVFPLKEAALSGELGEGEGEDDGLFVESFFRLAPVREIAGQAGPPTFLAPLPDLAAVHLGASVTPHFAIEVDSAVGAPDVTGHFDAPVQLRGASRARSRRSASVPGSNPHFFDAGDDGDESLAHMQTQAHEQLQQEHALFEVQEALLDTYVITAAGQPPAESLEDLVSPRAGAGLAGLRIERIDDLTALTVDGAVRLGASALAVAEALDGFALGGGADRGEIRMVDAFRGKRVRVEMHRSEPAEAAELAADLRQALGARLIGSSVVPCRKRECGCSGVWVWSATSLD